MLPATISGDKLTLESFVIRPNGSGRFPLVVITHGRPGIWGDAFFGEILNRSPVAYSKAAVAFAQRGYAVVSVMRRGYGRSGGGLIERLKQACDYLPAVQDSSEDLAAAVAALRNEPWIDADHVVLLGHSVGGLIVLAAAAREIPGVIGVINFDGGWHSFSAPNQPCSSDHLIETAARLGRSARIPALWLYAENDQSYGPDLAQRMFAAYTAEGAPAQLRMLPSFGTDGHNTVIEAPAENGFRLLSHFWKNSAFPKHLPLSPRCLLSCRARLGQMSRVRKRSLIT